MGLVGANNPIYQASQLQSEQAHQQKMAGVNGIINENLQTQQKKIAAQLQTAAILSQSKDPAIRKMGLEQFANINGKQLDPNIGLRMDEASTSLGELDKLKGKVPPDVFQGLVDAHNTNFSDEYTSPEKAKSYEASTEQGYLQQGIQAGRQIQATPELAKDTEAMNYAQNEKDRLLASGGTKGIELLGKSVSSGTANSTTKTINSWANALFDKGWEELTQPEQFMVMNEIQDRKVEVAGATTTAKGQAEQELPMSPSELSNLINPETLAPYTLGTTLSQAKGAVKISATDKEKLFALDNVSVTVDSLNALADQLITAEDAPSAAKQFAMLTGGAFAKTNQTATSYRDTKQAFIGTLSRALGGERGVLTDRDISRTVKALGSFADTKKIKDYKFGLMRILIDTATESAKKKMFGKGDDMNTKKRLSSLVEALTRESSNGVIPKDIWMKENKIKNPDYTDKELNDIYIQKYGG